MAYALKTTGLAVDCENLIIVDDDNTTVVDIGNTPATLVVDANVTIGTETWNSVSRKTWNTFQNGTFNFYGITFSLNPPVLLQGVSEGGNGFFMAGVLGPANKHLVYPGSSNYGIGRLASTDPIKTLRSNVAGITGATSFGSDYTDKVCVGYNHTHNTATTGAELFVDIDGGTAGWDTQASSANDTSTGATIVSLGGRSGHGYHECRWFCFANFNRTLTLTEYQSLRDDWFGTLVEGTATPTFSSGPTVDTIRQSTARISGIVVE